MKTLVHDFFLMLSRHFYQLRPSLPSLAFYATKLREHKQCFTATTDVCHLDY